MGFEMSTSTKVSEKKTEKQSRKKAYQMPTLIRYGQAKDLTTAGPAIAREASPGKKPHPL